MAFGHGLDAKFYYNEFDWTGYIEEISPSLVRALATYRPLGTTAEQSLPGIRSATIAVSGLYDPAADLIAAKAWDAFGDGLEHVFAYLPQGDVIGSYGYVGEAMSSEVSIPATESEVVKYPVAVVGSSNFDRAQILHILSEEESDGNDTTQDGAAPSSAGGRGYILTTAIEAGATNDVLIQHSENDADWSTLITFTQVTAAGCETIALATDATVYRYVRAIWDLSEGAGSDSTFFVAFARH